jgi:hypothetical protein
VPQSLVVLIAAPELLDGLRERFSGADVLAFPEGDVLRALETISTRRPDRVALEQAFASTSRGTALVNRLRADPALGHVEVQVVTSVAAGSPPPASSAPDAPITPSRALDSRGTRRATRVPVRDSVEIVVDGSAVGLVNLSFVGAQVVSASVLKPNQRVRVSLVDESGSLRISAVIAWAAYELPRHGQSTAHYRAGLDFLDADASAVAAFAERHARPA